MLITSERERITPPCEHIRLTPPGRATHGRAAADLLALAGRVAEHYLDRSEFGHAHGLLRCALRARGGERLGQAGASGRNSIKPQVRLPGPPSPNGRNRMRWPGFERGHPSDWATQRWVQSTGRRIELTSTPWLKGLTCGTQGIGTDFVEAVARDQGLEVRGDGSGGLVRDFAQLRGPQFDPDRVDRHVWEFYEHTSGFEVDAWAEWSGSWRPFGRLLATIFSRRLQQLNIPLSALDTSRGVTSQVVQLVEAESGEVKHTLWLRKLVGTGNILYAGDYSICRVPGFEGPCVKVVFPLPNGNAIVIMRPEARPDGSFSITSSGKRFGDPGFYFTVHTRSGVFARYVRAMTETIEVYPGTQDDVRADHVLRLWGARFLRFHYRLQRRRSR